MYFMVIVSVCLTVVNITIFVYGYYFRWECDMDVILISEVLNARRSGYYDMWHVIRTFHILGELDLCCYNCKFCFDVGLRVPIFMCVA